MSVVSQSWTHIISDRFNVGGNYRSTQGNWVDTQCSSTIPVEDHCHMEIGSFKMLT